MRYWALAAVVLAAVLVQATIAYRLAIGASAPDFLVVVTITYALLFGSGAGAGAGFGGGLLFDLLFGRFIGIHALGLGLTGLLAGWAEPKVFKESHLLPLAGGLAGTLAAQTPVALALFLLGWPIDLQAALVGSVLPGAAYSAAIAYPVYRLILRHYDYFLPEPRGAVVLRR